MVVYWDLAALWNFTLDYILLLGTLRLSGGPIRRKRLALGAALGASYSVAALALALPLWLLPAVMLLMCRIAFGCTERYFRLVLLFAMVSCGLGGAVLLLGSLSGNMKRLAVGLLCARVPWGVFLAAAGLSRLLLGVVFRGGARYMGGALVLCRIEYGGRNISLTLLRDTGNALTDPQTGASVPVISREAAGQLIAGELPERLRCRTVAGCAAELEAFRCTGFALNGKQLGPRLIAVSAQAFGNGYEGLWNGE